MRAKIRAQKNEDGKYQMICILPDGIIELPQEDKTHIKMADVYRDAYEMYGRCDVWAYNRVRHTIKID